MVKAFYIVDIGAPKSWLMRGVGAVLRHMEEAKENIDGLLPTLLQEAGFVEISEPGYQATLFGPLSFYRALKG